MPDEILKRCPWYGCTESYVEHREMPGYTRYWVQCIECEAQGPPALTEQGAREEWNRREYDTHWPVVVPNATVKLSECRIAEDRPRKKRRQSKAVDPDALQDS